MPAAANESTALLRSVRDTLTRLLDAVEPPGDLLPRFDAIKEKLAADLQVDRLMGVLHDAADLLVETWRQIEQERREWDTFLHQLTERLHELDKSLQGAEQQTIAAYYGGRKAESTLERQVDDIQSRLHSSANVEQMRSYIHQRVAVIRAGLEDNQGKEAQRFVALQAQLNKLTAEIREMEQDSAELRRRYEQSEAELLVDPATGIASRVAFEQRLQQELSRSKRYGSPFVVQLWEVDDFMALKEAYGQKASDKALQLIAKIMETALRETDFIARYASEKVAVLLPETSLEAAQWAADRLCGAIAKGEFHHRETPVTITVSCGYTAVQAEDTPEALLQRAHAALNQATSQGRNRYCAG